MIRVFLLFLVLAILARVLISVAQKMTGRQYLRLAKSLSYAIICSAIAIAAMFALVVLF
jgi:hypothetical protein